MNKKNEFPIFTNHPELVFLDSAASAQKPKVVLDAVREIHEHRYANIHRGLYSLSLEATKQFDEARKKVADFFGVNSEEIIFTKNGTEAANLFATSWGNIFLKTGDEIVLTIAEHHANLLPWMRLQEQIGIILKFVEPNEETVFLPEHFQEAISARTKLIAFPHVSNVTGQIFPVQEIVEIAKECGATTFLDACQSAPHFSVNFLELGVDVAFFTGHKMGATGGTGGLYARKEILDQMPPFLVGGDMVESVSREKFTPLSAPQKFEAGTPAIAEMIGLGGACEFITEIGLEEVRNHEKKLLTHLLSRFEQDLPEFTVIGTKNVELRSGLVSFFHPKIHAHDLAQFLDGKNICVRSGFHCAEILHQHLGLKTGSVRASFWIYNELSDIDALIAGLQEAQEIFQ